LLVPVSDRIKGTAHPGSVRGRLHNVPAEFFPIFADLDHGYGVHAGDGERARHQMVSCFSIEESKQSPRKTISKQSNVFQQCGALIRGTWARISSRYFTPAILPTSAASPVPTSETAHVCPHPLSFTTGRQPGFEGDPPLSNTGSLDTVVRRLARIAQLSLKLLQLNSQ
jgi:hypothetical protein